MKLKRLLSAIIAGAMVLGTMSISAFAAVDVAEIGTTKYESFEAALDAANANETVKLLQDTTVKALKIDKSLNVDLGGNTLKITGGSNRSSVGENVVICNGKIDCSGVDWVGNGIINVGWMEYTGTYSLTLKDIELVANNVTRTAFVIYVDGYGTNSLKLDNVEATVKNSALSYVFNVNGTGETATIKNSNITVENCPGAGVLLNFDSIENTVISAKNIGGRAIRNTNDIEISNSSVTIDGCESGIKVTDGKTLTVKNSVIDIKNPQTNEQCFALANANVDAHSVLTSSDTSADSYSNKDTIIASTQNIANASDDADNATVGFATTIVPQNTTTVLKGVKWTVTANGVTKTKTFDINNISGAGTTKLGLIITNIGDANATATAEAITE